MSLHLSTVVITLYYIIHTSTIYCFINILLYNKLHRLTKSTVFTLAPFERASFTPNKSPFLVDSIKLSF